MGRKRKEDTTISSKSSQKTEDSKSGYMMMLSHKNHKKENRQWRYKKAKANKEKQSMPVQAERHRPAIFRHKKAQSKGRTTCKVVATTKDQDPISVAPFLQLKHW